MPVGAKARIEEKVFAVKYLENGMNATEAVKEMKPQLTGHVAEVTASRMLKRVEEAGAIDPLLRDVKQAWSRAMESALALAERWVLDQNPQLQEKGMSYLRDCGPLFANASSGVKSLTQVNKYTLPKRK